MENILKNKTLLIIVILFCCVGCKKIKDYSTTPEIEFLNSKKIITQDLLGNKTYKITLNFYLIDGDGNVGLPNNAGNPYIGDSAYNYFSELFYLKDNKWNKDTLILSNTKNFIIPYIDNFLGTNKLLKANIFIDYEYTANLFPYDTISYSFYVQDREFNKSNIAFSDTIVFQK